MDEWMDRWEGGWTDGWMDGRICGRLVHLWLGGGLTDGWGWVSGRKWADGLASHGLLTRYVIVNGSLRLDFSREKESSQK